MMEETIALKQPEGDNVWLEKKIMDGDTTKHAPSVLIPIGQPVAMEPASSSSDGNHRRHDAIPTAVPTASAHDIDLDMDRSTSLQERMLDNDFHDVVNNED